MAQSMTKKELANIAGYTYRRLHDIDRRREQHRIIGHRLIHFRCDPVVRLDDCNPGTSGFRKAQIAR